MIDTKSAEITLEYDKKDQSIVCFSKLRICKILSEKDWNQKPITEKRFSRVFDPLKLLQTESTFTVDC